ncbi:cytosolic iron-sulfur assembly component 2B [Pantherophis guttatus]|uniref:Cytosolic iron-sulfur assembly component 2B n=1 Tax=Pantherophis guttatus TaxID=94885 RepID=A0ABM3YN15_PANGU|nr:cytosolic iron-sulfur assembly component 2B [Pantherophis guttatus]
MAHGRTTTQAHGRTALTSPGLTRKRCVGTSSPSPEVGRTAAGPSIVGPRPAVVMVGPLGGGGLENANPLVYRRQSERPTTAREQDEGLADAIDDREIFDLIRGIHDPEHPLTLEELNVVEQLRVQVSDPESAVSVEFTPTIPHCSMATLIGLSIKVKLIRSLPERFKVDVHITPGTHASEHAVNKQLADKERVAAALENMHLLQVVNQCLSGRS